MNALAVLEIFQPVPVALELLTTIAARGLVNEYRSAVGRGRGIDLIDVEPVWQRQDKQPGRAARDLQCRSAALVDLLLKKCLGRIRRFAEPQSVALRREAAVPPVGRLHKRGCYRTLIEHATRGGTKHRTNSAAASLPSQ